MSWSIGLVTNEVEISKACAKELFEVQDKDELWYDVRDVTDSGRLTFNTDHAEHMDYLGSIDNRITDVLRKHKVKGDICFGSLEGDNDGSFWGYRFDGKGGMKTLTGRVVYEEDEARAPSKAPAIEGQTFVITGTLDSYTRAEAEARIREAGGIVASGVSRKVDYVVEGANAGSKLDKAKALEITILDEETFSQMLAGEP